MKLPNIVFCRVMKDGDSEYLNAEMTADKALGYDDPTAQIGVYKLVQVQRVTRTFKVDKIRKPR